MTIAFNVNDVLRVNTSFVYETLASAVGKHNPVLQGVGYLSTGTSTVLYVGHPAVSPDSTPSVIQLLPADHLNPAYNDGQGVILYFSDDTTLNNTFELASAYLQDTLYALVLNNSGSSIPKNSVVRQSGYNTGSQLPTVALADATTATNSVVLGITQEAIANGSTGAVLVEGAIEGIDTSSFTQGADAFLSNTPGAIATSAGTVPVSIGKVTTASVNGVIFLRGLNPAIGGSGAAGATGIRGVTGLVGNTGIQGITGLASTGSYVVVARTSDTTLTSADEGKINTNTGTAIDIEIDLPALVIGQRYLFAVTAAFYMRVNNLNGSTTINLGTSETAAGGFVRSNEPGSMLEIIGVSATQWFARVTGDWTYDA